jgi:hypothetical protein
MSDSIEVKPAFSCDICGELFSSPKDAQVHQQKTHPEAALKDDSDRGL